MKYTYEAITGLLLLLFVFALSCNRVTNNDEQAKIATDTYTVQDTTGSHARKTTAWTQWLSKEQTGNLYITNYTLDENTDNQTYAIAYDHDNVMIFVNRLGILTFDGNKVGYIKTPGMAMSVFYDNISEKTFVGCSNSFGVLTKDDEGNYNYQEIQNSENPQGNIVSILRHSNYIYFASSDAITRLNVDNYDDNVQIMAESENPISGIFALNENLYANTQRKGISVVADTSLIRLNVHQWNPQVPIDTNLVKPLTSKYNLAGQDIIFSIPFSKTQVLLATSDNKLVLFNGQGFATYTPGASDYLAENYISSGVNMSETEFAVGTLSGGSVVINKLSGKTIATLNYQTGLPDEEVSAMGIDANLGLWIAHQYGVSRVDFSLPILIYSSYLGLEGNIAAVREVNNTVYVATSEGLYYLDKVQDYQQVEVLVKKNIENKRKFEQILNRAKNDTDNSKIEQKDAVIEKTDTDENNEPNDKKDNWIKNKWRRIKEKLTKEEAEKSSTEIEELQNNTEENKDSIGNNNSTGTERETTEEQKTNRNKNTKKFKLVAEKVYKLQSISHIYKKIEGIDAKCKQILPIDNKLLVVANNGVYVVENNVCTVLIPDIYATTIAKSKISNLFYIGSIDGLYIVSYQPDLINNQWSYQKFAPGEGLTFGAPVFSIAEVNKTGNIWVGGDNVAYNIKLSNTREVEAFDTYEFYNEYSDRIIVRDVANRPQFYSSSGIYGYNDTINLIYKQILYPEFVPDCRYITTEADVTWLLKADGWMKIPGLKEYQSIDLNYYKLFDNIQNIQVDGENIWIVDDYKTIYKIKKDESSCFGVFNAYIGEVDNTSGAALSTKSISLNHSKNAIKLQVAAPYYLKPHQIEFSFMIEGLDDSWSGWENKREKEYNYFPSGEYQLRMRARNALGYISEAKPLSIYVSRPYWQTWWFVMLVVLVVIYSVYLWFRRKQRKLHFENLLLEEKVQERTEQIRQQQKHITDSIQYASRIQRAILPPQDLVDEVLPQHFILSKPRDIVSGDYYWFSQIDDKLVVAVADCTGHGVPGAFLSMLGITMLNGIVNHRNITDPGEILNTLRQEVMKALHQTGERGESKDGMDIAICTLHTGSRTMYYAGAHNPLVFIRQSSAETEIGENTTQQEPQYEIFEIKADRMPVGIHKKDRKFTTHCVEYKAGDTFYLFSDGYADQFGQDAGRKFYLKQFKLLLLSIQDKPMSIQREILETTLEEWKGNIDQVDDILVLGVRCV